MPFKRSKTAQERSFPCRAPYTRGSALGLPYRAKISTCILSLSFVNFVNTIMEKTMAKLYLVSTSGDYSRFGMGDSNHALTVPKKYYALIKRFLKAQLEFFTNVMIGETYEE